MDDISLDGLLRRFPEIAAAGAARSVPARELGRSREGRILRGYRFGRGSVRVSLLAGCHADEPVGPVLLEHLGRYLASLQPDDPLLVRFEWWIVPCANPDGAHRNQRWQLPVPDAFDPVAMLADSVRELPGDDLEFGFPRDTGDREARPEGRAIHAWWREAGGAFDLHASLHGMAFGAGPWFLLEPGWLDRTRALRDACRTRTRVLGYPLHDVERQGEKGFRRIERGFSTRPDSVAMREHFVRLGDPDTAGRFRPSSMEAVRALGGDPLTLVPEVPLFLTPGVGESIGPPDPALESWKERIASWRVRLSGSGADRRAISEEMDEAGLRAMPVRDQMDLQWTFVSAGIEAVLRSRDTGRSS